MHNNNIFIAYSAYKKTKQQGFFFFCCSMKSHIFEERCTLTGKIEILREEKKERCWKQRAENVSKFGDKN